MGKIYDQFTFPVAIHFFAVLGNDDVIHEVIYEVIHGAIMRKFRALMELF